MAAGVMTTLICILVLRVLPAGASLSLTVNPSDITAGLTSSLTVNCSFSNDQSSGIANVISLIISKSGGASDTSLNYVELASVNTFSPDNITLPTPDSGASHQHHIVPNGNSYLSLAWTNPTLSEAGTYHCEVHGVDQVGHSKDITESKKVTGSSADTNSVAVIQALHDAQLQLDTLERQMADLLKGVGALTGAFTFFTDHFNGSRYLLSDTCHNSDLEAALVCGTQGGHLVQIDSLAEYNFLVDFVNRTADPEFEAVMTGGNDWRVRNHWVWRGSGDIVTVNRWTSASPLRYDDNRCILLDRTQNWLMENKPCYYQRRYTFLCEVPDATV